MTNKSTLTFSEETLFGGSYFVFVKCDGKTLGALTDNSYGQWFMTSGLKQWFKNIDSFCVSGRDKAVEEFKRLTQDWTMKQVDYRMLDEFHVSVRVEGKFVGYMINCFRNVWEVDMNMVKNLPQCKGTFGVSLEKCKDKFERAIA